MASLSPSPSSSPATPHGIRCPKPAPRLPSFQLEPGRRANNVTGDMKSAVCCRSRFQRLISTLYINWPRETAAPRPAPTPGGRDPARPPHLQRAGRKATPRRPAGSRSCRIPGAGRGAGRTFVALQHILVSLHELLLLAAVGRLLTRHVAGHGRPRSTLRRTPVPGPRAQAAAAAAPAPALCAVGGGGGGALAPRSPRASPGPVVALRSSAGSHRPLATRQPGSRFRLPTPRLRSSLSPPRRRRRRLLLSGAPGPARSPPLSRRLRGPARPPTRGCGRQGLNCPPGPPGGCGPLPAATGAPGRGGHAAGPRRGVMRSRARSEAPRGQGERPGRPQRQGDRGTHSTGCACSPIRR